MFKLRKMTRGWVFVGLAVCAVLVAGINPRAGEASSALLQATSSQTPSLTPRVTPSLARRAPRASVPALGAAKTFSVLAALSMSATAAGTTVSGDLGLSPGLAASKTGPWTVGGSQFFGTGGTSQTAEADALTAFNNLAGQGSNGTWAATPWSPVPGVWTAASDQTFAGTITLNGNYNDVWIFQVGRDMTFSGSVVLAGNAQACNVFWQIGRDAVIASGTAFVGTLIASRDVTLTPVGVAVNGRIISLNSSLTTGGTAITGPTCAAQTFQTQTAVAGLPPATQTAIAAVTQTAASGASTQTAVAAQQTAAAARVPAPARPAEVPEGDTLLLFGGGIGGLATWIGWQWRKARARSKQ